MPKCVGANGTDGNGRWKNLCRRSDYIGSWIFAEPEPRMDQEYLAGHVDQPCWDPVVLVPDANPARPPTNGHLGFWPDPRTSELGAHLVTLLKHRVHEPEQPGRTREPESA